MANDCDYKVRITGEPEDLQKLFNKLQCDEVKNVGHLHSDNYSILFESCDDVEDWGSKWVSFSNIDYYDGDTMMFIDGSSAWKPAEGFWQKTSKEFNLSIDLEYSEPGVGFAGVTEINDGEITLKDEFSYWQYLYIRDYDYFWEEIESRCDYSTLEEVIDELGDTYDNLSEDERLKIENIFN